MCPTRLEYRNLQRHLFTFKFSKTGKPWLWLNVTLRSINSCMHFGSWTKYGKWQCSREQGPIGCLRGLLSSGQCRGTATVRPRGYGLALKHEKRKKKKKKKRNKQKHLELNLKKKEEENEQINKNTVNWMSESGCSKFFCKVPDSKCFMFYRLLWSLWQLLSSTIVAWKQPKTVCSHMGMTVFQ